MAPSDSSDDILELTDIVEGDGNSSGDSSPEATDADFEQELEDLFAEELGEEAPTGEAEPIMLDDVAEEGDDSPATEKPDAKAPEADAEDDVLVLDDMVEDDSEPLVLDDIIGDGEDDGVLELGEDLTVSDDEEPLELGADFEVPDDAAQPEAEAAAEPSPESAEDTAGPEADEEPLDLGAEMEAPGTDDDLDLDGLEDALSDDDQPQDEEDDIDALLAGVDEISEETSQPAAAAEADSGDDLDAIELDDLLEEGGEGETAAEEPQPEEAAQEEKPQEISQEAEPAEEAGPAEEPVAEPAPEAEPAAQPETATEPEAPAEAPAEPEVAQPGPEADAEADDIDSLLADVEGEEPPAVQEDAQGEEGPEEAALDAIIAEDIDIAEPDIDALTDEELASLGGSTDEDLGEDMDDEDAMGSLLDESEIDAPDMADESFDLDSDLTTDAVVSEALMMRIDALENRLGQMEGGGGASVDNRVGRIEEMLMKAGAAHELELVSRVDVLENRVEGFKGFIREEVKKAVRDLVADEARKAVTEAAADFEPETPDTDPVAEMVREEVAKAVPAEAARIIREEIAALMNEMGD